MPMLHMLSGSYTGPGGAGLKLLGFDTDTGALELIRSFQDTPDVSWIVRAATTGTVYVTDEMGARVGAFGLADDLSEVTPLGYRPTGAKYPCYLRLSPKGTKIAVANYGDDSVPVFSLGPDGALGEAATVLRSAHAPEQGHAHWVQWSPEADRVYTVDLGHDELRFHRYEAGSFVGGPETAFSTPKGAGPRHLAFHPDGGLAYLFTEYGMTLTSLARRRDGSFKEIATRSSLPADFADQSTDKWSGAHLEVSATGATIYVSNRGHNSISVFRAAPDGDISLIQNIATGGDWPRFFLLMEKHLIAANQKSDSLVVFDIAADGTLAPNGHTLQLEKPVSLLPL